MARRKKTHIGWLVGLILFGLYDLALIIALLLGDSTVALFSPKGLIAREQHSLMLIIVGVMLVVAIPTWIILYAFAWKYRESNEKAAYAPNARHGKFFVPALWSIPLTVLLILTSFMWPATHRLDPHNAIASDKDELVVQVVAMRWKWLFIYPEQGIASLNYVQIPTDTPVRFELSADEAPMNSFWIPQLGGQLYAMTGHSNALYLLADTVGDYNGQAAEINGSGFAGMKFIARASSETDFGQWVNSVKQSSKTLDAASYSDLLRPSENNQAEVYVTAEPDLYAKVLMKYSDAHDHSDSKHADDETHHEIDADIQNNHMESQ